MSLNSCRSNIERLTKDIASLKKNIAKEHEKIVQFLSNISSIKCSITNTKSSSILQSRQRQIDTKEKEVARCLKKIADLEGKNAVKLAELNRNSNNLAKAEELLRAKQKNKHDFINRWRIIV